jgi:hypothetical protein
MLIAPRQPSQARRRRPFAFSGPLLSGLVYLVERLGGFLGLGAGLFGGLPLLGGVGFGLLGACGLAGRVGLCRVRCCYHCLPHPTPADGRGRGPLDVGQSCLGAAPPARVQAAA